MLLKCPECDLPVSDKAIGCPHCGYPLKPQSTSKSPTKRKHLKLPNGFGRITHLNNPRLRNKYRAMVTVGKTDTGKPIGKLLKPKAYFSTYNEAYEALVKYNKNPYDLVTDVTVKRMYEIWSEEYFKSIAPSATRTVTSAWVYCSKIYDLPIKALKAHHIKTCMDSGTAEYKGVVRTPSAATKSRIKSIFNLMLDYAVEFEYVDRNVSRTFKISDAVLNELEIASNQHIRFTNSELETLWKNIDTPYVDVILIQCYMGWRPQELGLLLLENVNIINWTITGGMKTDSGTNRTVPIHPAIRPLVQKHYDVAITCGRKYLFSCSDGRDGKDSTLTYDKYRRRFQSVCKTLGLNSEHRAHDPRKTFVSIAKDSGVDEYAIKRIVGHKISDITEAIYTTRDPNWLSVEVEKIKVPVDLVY